MFGTKEKNRQVRILRNTQKLLAALESEPPPSPTPPSPPTNQSTLEMDLPADGWEATSAAPTISEVLPIPMGKRVIRIESLMRMRGLPVDPSLWNLLVWMNEARQNGAGTNAEMALYALWRDKKGGSLKWRNGFTGDANMTQDMKHLSPFNEDLTTFRFLADYDAMTNTVWWNGTKAESDDVPQLLGHYAGLDGMHVAIGGIPFNDSETWPKGIIFDSMVVHVDTER